MCQRSEVQNALQTQRLGICKSSDACSIDHPPNVAQATFWVQDVFKLLRCAYLIFTRVHRPLNAAVRKVKWGKTSKLYFLLPLDFPGTAGCPESLFLFFIFVSRPPCYSILRAYERLYLRAGVGRAERDVQTARTVNISSGLCMAGARHGFRGLWRAPGFITARIATITTGILLSLSRYHQSPLNNSPVSEC